MNKCCDCSKKSDKRAIRCRDCYIKWSKLQKQIKICLYCDKELSSGNKGGRCCSCAAKYRFKNKQNHPRWSGGKTLQKYYCCDCDIEICYRSERCESCASKYYGLFHSGENHPNWKGGKSFEPYPLGWTKTFKEQIRYRDRYKCQNCGKPEIECKVSLHVHHIDYDKKNLEVNNLISLCPSCHTKSNFSRVYWQEFYQNKIKSMGYRNGRSDNNNQEATQGSI